MDPDLLRQRRNLIAISLVLLLFDFAEVQIGKVSVLGTELLVGDPQVLMTFAWLMWAYFFLRYYQYWRRDTGQAIRSAYRKEMVKQQYDFAERWRIKHHPTQGFHEAQVEKVAPLRYELAYTVGSMGPGNTVHLEQMRSRLPGHELPMWRVKSVAYVVLHSHLATDHLLPFALAVAAPIVTVLH